jgi:hypothetical protein
VGSHRTSKTASGYVILARFCYRKLGVLGGSSIDEILGNTKSICEKMAIM